MNRPANAISPRGMYENLYQVRPVKRPQKPLRVIPRLNPISSACDAACRPLSGRWRCHERGPAPPPPVTQPTQRIDNLRRDTHCRPCFCRLRRVAHSSLRVRLVRGVRQRAAGSAPSAGVGRAWCIGGGVWLQREWTPTRCRLLVSTTATTPTSSGACRPERLVCDALPSIYSAVLFTLPWLRLT
jgi:hypothetical protein